MRFIPTAIDGVCIVDWDVNSDERGGFSRSFCEAEMAAAGIPFHVAQINVSTNPRVHTLRGLHYQAAPHEEPKIVSCLRGRIYDVAVDLREDSPSFLRWEAVELSGGSSRSVHIASGLAHGFLSLEPDSEVQYLMGAPYVAGAGRGLRWNDPAIAIAWPAEPEVISARDAEYPLLVSP